MIETDTGVPPRNAHESYDEETDLREYGLVLWRHHMMILVSSLVCAALVVVLGLSTRRTYAARAVLAISQSKISSGQVTGSPTAITTAAYRPILESQNLASRIIREFGLDQRRFSATGFFGNVVDIEEVRNSTVFILKAALDDPDLAARVANRTAELAIEQSRLLNEDEAARSRDNLKAQFDDAQARMQQAEAKVLTFRNASQLELLRKDVDAALEQRGGLLRLLVQIESEKAKLAKAEQELAGRRRLDTVKRSIDSDPALMESARTTAPRSGDLLGLQIQDESINKVYEEVDSEIAKSRSTLAASERQKDQLVNVRKLDAPQLALLARLYNVESEFSRLQIELDLARKVYQDVATAYETARLQVAGRSAELRLVEAALPPDRPLSRNIMRNAVIAFVVGLMMSAFFVLAYDFLRTPAHRS